MEYGIILNITGLGEEYNEEAAVPSFSHQHVFTLSTKVDSRIQKVVDLIIITFTILLNTVVLLSVFMRKSLYTSVGCYILSLILSNIVNILDLLRNVIVNWFNIKFKTDHDYINQVTFRASICTVTMLTVDRYISFCCKETSSHRILTKASTAVKGVIIIWSFCSITTIMELHLYDHYVIQTGIILSVFTTTMYLITTTFIIIFLITMIIVQLKENKITTGGTWRSEQSDSLRLLVGIVVGLYITIVPDRILTVLYYTSSFCCSLFTRHVCFYLAKFSSIICPVIWIGTSKLLRQCIKKTFCCNRRS
ncbi:melanocortin receptor 4-like isoform X2 [Microplitis mediator]|uniref:melanocortin receptor 4-like isoform X2 n=1 Tax=Microplitis mediator TaxID=375433 RepID=UPI0025550581|nr:melanocortin receptor 4-like isoform X2 [Microplitis mediator]